MQPTTCPACSTASESPLEFCSKCQFPFNGNEKEKSSHIGRFITEKNIVQDSEKAILKSRRILFIISGLNLLMAIIAIFSAEDLFIIDAIVYIFIAAVFALFASFIRRSPIVFTIIPLLFLLMIYLIDAVYDPGTIARGFIFRLFIIGSLGYGAYQCYKAEKFRKKYNS